MSTTWTLKCTNQSEEATLLITQPLLPPGEWSCKEGESVWGKPSKGGALKDNPSGTLLLSAGAGSDGHYLYDFTKPKVGSSGKGTKQEDVGGSFPSGEFDWKCTRVE
ncbi:hypothetical protein SAMN05216315_101121 [Nitrosospira sp. Nsp18]|uniref:hypothetical protein n=1 Tax=Nitrosospira sp. Nsp18 TaxID=1855334 RepID=UPI000888D635|nr:hypothetical protein [Nitrosospira sp. Nsp18]SDA09818.1 hypothetical protein SAMN05216315_101121 [Nitrosospira sp. Nsp18]